uniref:Uncharacterized protein n=1 Tax=Xiphophorus couchianus TaxID=32473 RepID=A0A3B5LHY4_9TELE
QMEQRLHSAGRLLLPLKHFAGEVVETGEGDGAHRELLEENAAAGTMSSDWFSPTAMSSDWFSPTAVSSDWFSPTAVSSDWFFSTAMSSDWFFSSESIRSGIFSGGSDDTPHVLFLNESTKTLCGLWCECKQFLWCWSLLFIV